MGSRYDLRGVALFKNVNGCAIATLLAVATQKSLPKGAVFFREGEPAEHGYLVVTGHVKLVQTGLAGDQVVVRVVGPGEMLGWVASMGGGTFPGTAEAVADCVGLCWDRHAIRQAVLHQPELALNALEVLGTRLREVQDRLREVITERVEQRLARALLRLAEAAGRPAADGVAIAFPVSRQMLAETAGATLHTASRIVAAWTQLGIVAGGRGRLVVLRPERLRAIADGAPADER